ncbi:MAG: ECF transporter S component [Ruminococcaceae bacterium]|nr:ECF transporter S component [Oscillospiraceae bacterium]
MKQTRKQSVHTKKLVLLAILSAIVAVLAYYGGFIKIGGLASISLTLIPVVIGSTLCGPMAGAWLGSVAGAIFFLTPDAAFWLGLSVPGTIITVMVKGAAAGWCAGVVYKLLESYNRYIAVVVSAIVCPVVNTGIFLLGSLIFFMDAVSAGATAEGVSVGGYLIVFFVGLNFVFELIANIAISPAMVKILDIVQKRNK